MISEEMEVALNNVVSDLSGDELLYLASRIRHKVESYLASPSLLKDFEVRERWFMGCGELKEYPIGEIKCRR